MAERTLLNRTVTLLVACGLVGLSLSCGMPDGGSPRALRPHPNVVLVVVDALRADHLGCYGYDRETTPEIDRLAENALVFANAYSNATFTFPSTASIFTATLPVVHRIAWHEDRQEQMRRISDEYTLLTEVFHDAGYRTGLLTFPGWVSPTANYMQGVDVRVESKRDDRDLLEHARQFIEQSAQGPFFLYLHFIELHDYFHPQHLFEDVDPAAAEISQELLALRDMTNRGAYRSMVRDLPAKLTDSDLEFLITTYDRKLRETDSIIGDLARHLERQGLLEDTLLAITADHGEQFLEHGLLVHGGDAFYNDVLRVPFVVSNPALFEVKESVTIPVSSIDIGPTLLDLAGLDAPPVFQGESLIGRNDDDRVVFATDGQTWKAVSRHWSYIVSKRNDREELYDLSSDPGETRNLAAENAEMAAVARAQVAAMRRQSQEHEYMAISVEEFEMPEEQKEALRKLGYVE